MKFESSPIREHEEVPLADDGQWEDIVESWSRRDPRARKLAVSTGNNRTDDDASSSSSGNRSENRSYVVSIAVGENQRNEARLAELTSLVRSQGDQVAGSEIISLPRPNARMLLGSGKAAALAERAHAANANMLVVDASLSPSQTRNLEDATGFAVSDREAVILNVFSRNARSRRARIQVEIAHLQYLRPRIRGIGLEMDQQAGGVMGSRGSGETASELLARKLDGRLARLLKTSEKLDRAEANQRKRRSRCDRIALIGYTNAGKTSLMNALTSAGLSAADRPFETLDSTSRSLTRHGGEVLISDTVGFIRELPERLFSSFASTLAEIHEASLLAIVLDLADCELELHRDTTFEVIERLGANQIPRLIVFNKLDCLVEQPTPADLERLSGGYQFVAISSQSSESVSECKRRLLQTIRKRRPKRTIEVPYLASEAISLAYARTRVIEVVSSERGLVFTVEAEPQILDRIEKLVERSMS